MDAQPQDPFGPAGPDPATLAVRDLIAAARVLTGRMAKAMDMNANDMSAIGALTQFGPLGVSELGERLAISSASATALVDRLERSGHVRRVRDTEDRRRVNLTETTAARDASYRAWSPALQAMNAVAAQLSHEERAVVVDFLDAMTAICSGS